ncbi:butyrate kinase [Paludibacter sp. 221]|uniref:butyrate kinase n=1 Tax=Paludibacter sp. 221 TaxID=2302939 RepID=UPI001942CB5E|nr:butyrate kinase [Paludibacter sp. 221]
MYKIISVNPGSTSTKLAYYEDETLVFQHTIRHSAEELKPYEKIFDQYEFRKNLILDTLKEKGVTLSEISAVVGRGGLLRPIESGVYEVNDRMIADLRSSIGGEHASNMGAMIAREIAGTISGCRAFIADPIVVDELQDVARISGLPEIPRQAVFHALNHKAIARKYAADNGKRYEDLNLVIAHLGGGISVAAHQCGRVVDVNQAIDGYGAFSPERAGTLDAGALMRMCFSGKYTQSEIQKMLCGKGGLMAHLGTNEAHVVERMANEGDRHAKLILEAMAYTVVKEIGAMHAVLAATTDAIILTGGIANNKFVVSYIERYVRNLAPLVLYPGEDEMGALALSGLRVLRGEMAKEY